jgi:ubiquitin-like-conjugating enzyme ATG3
MQRLVARLLAPPTVSCFKQKGFLTPEEFVQAGNVLVHSCRTWQWESGDAAAALPYVPQSLAMQTRRLRLSHCTCRYLPKDKQFLVTSNVPCRKRARGLKTSLTGKQLYALSSAFPRARTIYCTSFLWRPTAPRPLTSRAERTVEDDVDGGWTETLTDATGSSGGGAAAIEDAVEAAAGGMAAVSVSDEVDLDDIPDADDESAAVSVSCSSFATPYMAVFTRGRLLSLHEMTGPLIKL